MFLYRIKQFYWAIIANIQSDNKKVLNEYLTNTEISVFMQMSKSERMHSIRVYTTALDYIKKNKVEIDTYKLARCTLLHDIGKSKVKINTIEKSIVIILKFITGNRFLKYNKKIESYYKHGELGAQILTALGENDKDIINCVKNHHSKYKDTDNIYLKVVSLCDNCS